MSGQSQLFWAAPKLKFRQTNIHTNQCMGQGIRSMFRVQWTLVSTGKSLSEALLFAEHGENILCTEIVLNVKNIFCTQHVLPIF